MKENLQGGADKNVARGGGGRQKMECPILFSAPTSTFHFAPPPPLSAYKGDKMEFEFNSKQIPKNLKYPAIEFHERRNSTVTGSKPEVFAP